MEGEDVKPNQHYEIYVFSQINSNGEIEIENPDDIQEIQEVDLIEVKEELMYMNTGEEIETITEIIDS